MSARLLLLLLLLDQAVASVLLNQATATLLLFLGVGAKLMQPVHT